MSERAEYNLRQSGDAAAAEHGMGDLWSEVAFLLRYGSASELEARCRQLGGVVEWWARRGPQLQAADLEAVKALDEARERLEEIMIEAERIEQHLRERWGYAFDPENRRIKQTKEPGERGRPKDLVSEWAGRCFKLMTEKQGWPMSNTSEAREEIASRLSGRVHPDDLDVSRGGMIYSAVNAALHDDRHY